MRKAILFVFCCFLILAVDSPAQNESLQFDILIKNGKVVDGTGNPWWKADVGVRDGKIARIGDLSQATGTKTIDAEGLVVTPGFIDIHNHSDRTILVNPKAESMIRQGVTTMVIGQCGSSGGPNEERTFGEFLAEVRQQGAATNLAPFIGHGSLRGYVMGGDDRPPTSEEMAKMKSVVDEAIRVDGAFGLSSGLAYSPGMFAETEEVTELCTVVAKYDGIYATHVRDDAANWEKSVREAIEIAEKSGARLQVSHNESHYPNWGKEADMLKLIEEARARGVEVTTDVPPYTAGSQGIYTILPNWALDGGTEALLKRLESPEERAKIRKYVFEEKEKHTSPAAALMGDGYADKIWIASSSEVPDAIGKNLAQIAEMRGVEPLDGVFELIQEEGGGLGLVIEHHYEPDLRILVSHPLCMIESDGAAHAPYGELSEGQPHPRSYGVFPLTFRKYVRGETRADMPREEGEPILTLQEAVRKMTSFPAQKLRLMDRGLLREGMWADITILDLETITDQATYTEPHQYPKGIPYVIVNGKVVIEREEHTGALPGKVLRSRK